MSALSEIGGPMIASTPFASSSANASFISCSLPIGKPRPCTAVSSMGRVRRSSVTARPTAQRPLEAGAVVALREVVQHAYGNRGRSKVHDP